MNQPGTGSLSVEDRAGSFLASRLDEGLVQVGPDISERLRFAREKALARARQARLHAAAQGASSGVTWAGAGGLALAGAGSAAGGGAGAGMSFGGWGARLGSNPDQGSTSSSWWSKLASALPLLILALGFLAIQDTLTERQIQAAAEVDAALLADDLPPQAYSDPGFAEFLRRQER